MNQTAEDQLAVLARSNDRGRIERKLFLLADAANIEQPGPLDSPDTHMKRMPTNLLAIRKKQFGRHRVYYVGNYKECRYRVVFIKVFKRSGVQDDDDRDFQRKLALLLGTSAVRVLPPQG